MEAFHCHDYVVERRSSRLRSVDLLQSLAMGWLLAGVDDTRHS